MSLPPLQKDVSIETPSAMTPSAVTPKDDKDIKLAIAASLETKKMELNKGSIDSPNQLARRFSFDEQKAVIQNPHPYGADDAKQFEANQLPRPNQNNLSQEDKFAQLGIDDDVYTVTVDDKEKFKKLALLHDITQQTKKDLPFMGNQSYYSSKHVFDGMVSCVAYNDALSNNGKYALKAGNNFDWPTQSKWPASVQTTHDTLVKESKKILDATAALPEEFRDEFKNACFAKLFGVSNCQQTSGLSGVLALHEKINNNNPLLADVDIFRYENHDQHHNFTFLADKSEMYTVDGWTVVSGTELADKNKNMVHLDDDGALKDDANYELHRLYPEEMDDKTLQAFKTAAKFVAEYTPERQVSPHELRLYDAALKTERDIVDDDGDAAQRAEVSKSITDLNARKPDYSPNMKTADAVTWSEDATKLPSSFEELDAKNFFFNVETPTSHYIYQDADGNKLDNSLPDSTLDKVVARHKVVEEIDAKHVEESSDESDDDYFEGDEPDDLKRKMEFLCGKKADAFTQADFDRYFNVATWYDEYSGQEYDFISKFEKK